ncbi:MAG: hypothetical protein GY847_41070 [Proteobacteria bacterium]|nr:hypothetical protein [Pseudomonadota bacterium]
MTIYSIDELEAGWVLAEDIRNTHGQLVLPAGCVLADKHIQTFKGHGIVVIDIKEEGDSEEVEIDPAILEKAEKQAEELFVHADLSHPLIDRLFQLSVQKIAYDMAIRDRDG